jgi:hypothetical protein
VNRPFGLSILDLPEPFVLPDDDDFDLRWVSRRGAVPGDVEGWIREEPDGAVVVGWGQWAEFRLHRGERRVEATIDSVSDADAATAFLASVLPLALPLFGLEPLHGSAVQIGDGRAALFLGDRGAGKSTITALLDANGWPFVTDDTCALDVESRVFPGPPILTPRGRGFTQKDGGSYNGKGMKIPVATATTSLEPALVIVLDPSLEVGRSERLDPREAFQAILQHARASWFMAERRRELQLRVVATLASGPLMRVGIAPDDHAGTVATLESLLRSEMASS